MSFDLRDFDRAIKETKIKNTEHTADELIIVNMWIFKIVPKFRDGLPTFLALAIHPMLKEYAYRKLS